MKRNLDMSNDAILERRATIVRMTALGHSAQEIGTWLGISERSVQRHRMKAGITKGPTEPVTDEQIRAAKQLLEDGAPYTEVARTVGRSANLWARKFPGYGWTKEQAIEFRWLNERLREVC